MTYRAFKLPPVVITALPVGQPPIFRHSSIICGPPARWMAPSTPPPPLRPEFAAFTMASVSCFVMSPWTNSKMELLIFICIIHPSLLISCLDTSTRIEYNLFLQEKKDTQEIQWTEIGKLSLC